MAEIVKVRDVAQYDVGQYERMLGQLPNFRMRGDELKAYVAKMISHGTLYAVDEGGRLLGHAGFYANDMVGRAGYFSSMAVDSSLRGQGWGDRLMDRVFEDCRAAGMREVRATVLKDNALAIEMYKRRGCRFTECEGDPTRFSISFPMDYPRLSIVCLAYNAAAYIRQALDGFLMQKTRFPFEVLVHDDASTDGTSDIIREYVEKFPETVRAVLQKENQFSKGVTVSSRFLWPLVRGKYVAVCEGDDYWTDPLKLQRQVDWLDAHPESSVCFHPVVVHFEDGSRPDSVYPSPKDCPDGFTFRGLLRHNFMQTNSVVYRWKLKGRECDVPLDIAPRDWFTNLVHAEKGEIGFLPEAMGVYRRHSGGVWWSTPDAPDGFYLRMGFRHLAFYRAVKERFGYDNPDAVPLAASTVSAFLRAGEAGRAAEVVSKFPEYAMGVAATVAGNAKLEKELSRARRRLKRAVWIAAALVAALVAALANVFCPLSSTQH